MANAPRQQVISLGFTQQPQKFEALRYDHTVTVNPAPNESDAAAFLRGYTEVYQRVAVVSNYARDNGVLPSPDDLEQLLAEFKA